MHRFLIALAFLPVALAIAVAPTAAQPAGVVIGDDDLPNGAPIQPIASVVKRVCYVGPANRVPNCIFDTIAQCRAECRTKRLHNGLRGRVQCILNPAFQQRRAMRPVALQGR